jgi:hypothetical protein
MDQNIGALHATNSMLDKDAHATQGGIGSLLLIAQLRVGVLCALARLPRRDVKPVTLVVRLNAKIASIDSDIDIYKPVHLRRQLLFQHEVIVIVTTKRPPQKDDQLVRERHDRIFQRMLFFFPLSCSRCLASSADR